MSCKFYILDDTGTTRHKHTFSSAATQKPNAGQHLNFPWLALQGLCHWAWKSTPMQRWSAEIMSFVAQFSFCIDRHIYRDTILEKGDKKRYSRECMWLRLIIKRRPFQDLFSTQKLPYPIMLFFKIFLKKHSANIRWKSEFALYLHDIWKHECNINITHLTLWRSVSTGI